MQQVVIKGVTYTKATDVAEEFGYTSDYVGQLCRESEVSCRKVGRAWFVDIASMVDYRANRHKSDDVETDHSKKKSDPESYKVEIHSGLSENLSNKSDKKVSVDHDNKNYKVSVKARPAKMLPRKNDEPNHYASRILWKPLQYETDSEELLPKLNPKERTEPNTREEHPPVKLNVNPYDAKPLSVDKTTDSYSMDATEVPRVALNGTLKVQSFEPPDITSNIQNNNKNNVIPQSPKQLINTAGKLTIPNQSPRVPPRPPAEAVQSSSVRELSQSGGTPVTRLSQVKDYPDATDELLVDSQSSRILHFAVFTLLVLILGVAFAIISLEGAVVATDANFSEHLTVDLHTLTTFLK